MQGSILKVAVICNLQLQHIYNNAFKYYFIHHNEILEEDIYFVKLVVRVFPHGVCILNPEDLKSGCVSMS